MFDVASAMTECGVSAHEKCSIYGANCAQWMIAMQVRMSSQFASTVVGPPVCKQIRSSWKLMGIALNSTSDTSEMQRH